MELSSDLISKFVKLAKDNGKNDKKETTLYGEVSHIDSVTGQVYVKLDGSDTEYTELPITDTVEVSVGNRVMVIIKNHSAIITANLDDPSGSKNTASSINAKADQAISDSASAKTDATNAVNKVVQFQTAITERLDTDELTAEMGSIDHLTAEQILAEVINVNTGKIGDLETDNVDIKGRLTAAEAEIEGKISAEEVETTYVKTERLESEYTNTEGLVATYATISELNNVKSTIQTLDTDLATIDDLIFGTATGTTINTNFANQVISQIGDAQIKDAMIDTVSADKVTALNLLAGTINTNNVTISSTDGGMKIYDNTIQIKDTHQTVRVQIGKDASNDYSINIWDADGKLMFSEGGITADGIPDNIIRNDMVASDANIHGSKLDIDSLFEEINEDGTNTIKSTKIYLDDEGQTLDVAFKTLATTESVDGLTETVTSQGTQIAANANAISTKVWQQDIDTAKNEMTTQYSTLEQDLGSFKTTVSSTYSTKTELNNISIGGRNLLKNSRHLILRSNNDNLYPISSEVITEKGREFTRYKRTSTDSYSETMSLYSTIASTDITEHLTNKEVTFSFLIRCSHETHTSIMGVLYAESISSSWHTSSTQYDIGTDWIRLVVTQTITKEYPWDTTSIIRFNPLFITIPTGEIDNFYIDICEWKIELGNKATDWTPAPEDMATTDSVEDAKTTAESADTKAIEAKTLIQQLSDSISMLVTDGNGTSLMTQTEDGWTFSTANIQSSINSTSESLSELQNGLGSTNSTVGVLQQAVADLGILSEYVKITTYEDEPCIELGEGDSDFKLLITNTRILFKEGSATPAYITNQSLHIKTAVIEEELQQGGYIWKSRSNGNLGLTWKGGNS